MGFGAYALWETGLFRWTWWIVPGCWLMTYGLTRFWKPSRFRTEEVNAPEHWTPADESALKIVTEYQKEVDKISPEQLTDFHFYLDKSQQLAQSLAIHYHPESQDLYSSLTLLEVLAAIRLAVEDLEDWFLESVPGSHVITINQWKMLGHAPKWVKRIRDTGWFASMLINPLNVAKFFTAKLTLEPITDELRAEFLAMVYLRFIRLAGFYLIEMNSGRLRRGADRYRAAFSKDENKSPSSDKNPPTEITPQTITVAVMGQVKAGKSSLVNALLGRTETAMGATPTTRTNSRHEVTIPGSDETLVLLDTPGYAESGASRHERKEIENAVTEADVVLLVTAANSPGKRADVEMLESIQNYFSTRHELKPAPIIVCLTHIDALSPMMEWSPPYNWKEPQSLKEENIAAAVAAVQKTFREFPELIVHTVPLCTDLSRGRTFNIEEELIPTIASCVSSGKTVAMVKAYEKMLDQDRLKTLLQQLKSSGQTLLQTYLDERLLKKKHD